MLATIIAELAGNFHVAFAALGSAVGIGMVGKGAAEALGRNPGAFGKVMVMSILAIAFAESIVFFALFLAK